ncbi:MAG: M28 family peptidase [Rhodothermaceae bacterium]|nr:M28 family peptidase [Rhodothermaceae bacterium]
MKHLLLTATLLLGLAASAFAQTPTVLDDPALTQRYQATITPDELAGHLYVYASDYFEGRETGTRGQHLAALYLAGQHQTMGLMPKGTAEATGPHDPRAFLQPFALEREAIRRADLTVRRGSSVRISEYGTSEPVGEWFAISGDQYLAFGPEGESEAGVVFGGYGIASETYDDYAAMDAAGINLAGQWLLLLDDEPMDASGQSLITEDGTLSDYSRNGFQKIRTVLQRGSMPAGFLLVSNDDDETLSMRAQGQLRRMGGLSLPSEEEDDGVQPRQIPPIYVISADLANAILGDHTVEDLQATINDSLTPEVFAIEGTQLGSRIEKATETVMVENVAAFLEGSDPVLKDEVVVISAHLDHIGTDPTAEDDGISNGADDDGSGTIALLEIAEAFQQAKADGHGPRRSILFLHVTGEEKGLLGSAYYADSEPLLPLANTVANLNIDMIGRHDPTYEGSDQYVDIIGAELISTDIDEINTRVNDVTGLGLELSKRYNSPDDPNQFFRRSDHWNFGKHDIPFIFYFNGTHEDYHGIDDEPEKIDYDLLALRTRLVFGTAWQLANQDARPAVSGVGFN